MGKEKDSKSADEVTPFTLLDAAREVVDIVKDFTPGQRGVIINTAQQVIGVMSRPDTSELQMFGVDE